MRRDHWIRRSMRWAGLGAWASAAVVAAPFALAGLAVGGADSALEMSAGGVVVALCFFGPVFGGALGAARAPDGGAPRVDRAIEAGAVYGWFGALALWGIDQMVGQAPSDAWLVALGGLLFGVAAGAVCGSAVLYARRRGTG